MNHSHATLAFHAPATTDAPHAHKWVALAIPLLVVAAALLSPGAMTVIVVIVLLLAALAWIATGARFDWSLLRALAPFGLMLFIGLAAGIGADTYLYFKDAWYILNPPMTIAAGYVLYRYCPDIRLGMKAFVLSGVVLSLIYLAQFVIHPNLIALPAAEVRRVAGYGYYAPPLAFSILCVYFRRWRNGLGLQPWAGWASLTLCAIAMTLSFSRTILLVAIIGLLAWRGLFARREGWHLLILGAGFAVTLFALQLIHDAGFDNKTFIGKLAGALGEISDYDYVDTVSIFAHWRAYETSRVLSFYTAGNPLSWLFGHGFGAQVDLGLAAPLGDTRYGNSGYMRQIPIFHNGYAYLLVKGGAAAVLLYGASFGWLYWVGRRNAVAAHTEIAAPARVLQAATVSIAAATAVWLAKNDMFPFQLAVGYLLAMLTSRRKALRTGLGLAAASLLPRMPGAQSSALTGIRNGGAAGFNIGRDVVDRPDDLEALAQTGANVVRVFFPFTLRDGAFQISTADVDALRRLLDWALDHHVEVVIVGDFGGIDNVSFWQQPSGLRDSFVGSWQQFARIFGNHTAIAGLDLLNEPDPPWPSGQLAEAHGYWRPLAEQTIGALRSEQIVLPVIFEGVAGAAPYGLHGLEPFRDRQVIYSIHHYAPHEITHQHVSERWPRTIPYPCGPEWGLGAWDRQIGVTAWNRRRMELDLRDVAAFQRRHHVPILVGEFSCVRWAPNGSRERYLADCLSLYQKYGWSWIYHDFRGWTGWDAENSSADPASVIRTSNSRVFNLLTTKMREVRR